MSDRFENFTKEDAQMAIKSIKDVHDYQSLGKCKLNPQRHITTHLLGRLKINKTFPLNVDAMKKPELSCTAVGMQK